MNRRLVAGIVALIAIGGVFAFGLSKQDDVSHIDTKHVVVPPAGFQPFAAASITGTSFSGAPFSLAKLEGKPVFINFWGSWCIPCRREAPVLKAFSRTLGSQASFVGVAYQSPHAKAVAFAHKAGWRYPIVAADCCALGDRYGVVYMPTTIVVDSKGQVVDRLIGPQTVARLTAELHALGA
jgi:cytochrome c biogenesis protein CcmG/thiol:disulfide interchange protein DsbE